MTQLICIQEEMGERKPRMCLSFCRNRWGKGSHPQSSPPAEAARCRQGIEKCGEIQDFKLVSEIQKNMGLKRKKTF